MALNKKDNLVVVENVIANTSVNVISITEDKLENILIKHLAIFKKSKDWIGSLALFITVLATLLTSNFHTLWGLEPAVFQAIFLILLVVSFIYFIITLLNVIRHKDSIDSLINDIKNQQKSLKQ